MSLPHIWLDNRQILLVCLLTYLWLLWNEHLKRVECLLMLRGLLIELSIISIYGMERALEASGM